MPTLYTGREAFEPETIRVLTAAFEDAWRSLDNDGTDLGPHTDVTRDTLAKGIIVAAMLGERDPQKLRDAALTHLRDATRLEGNQKRFKTVDGSELTRSER
jgi:hypothetical protein